ncbi:MAG TPA: amino acid permease, partial [Dehalococcoidia bacterium]|nr:amino acid permease [Dehalococcoidia bacterium]
WEALAASDAPLADVTARALGARAADAVAVVALFSTGNTMLLLLVTSSRLIYGMASTDALPRLLAWIHPGVRTPARAIVLSLFLAAAFTLSGDLSFVAGATNFAVFVGFGAIAVSVLLLRRSMPDERRPFRAPFQLLGVPVIPVAALLLTLLLLANLAPEVLLLGAFLFVSGIVAMEALALWRPDATTNRGERSPR